MPVFLLIIYILGFSYGETVEEYSNENQAMIFHIYIYVSKEKSKMFTVLQPAENSHLKNDNGFLFDENQRKIKNVLHFLKDFDSNEIEGFYKINFNHSSMNVISYDNSSKENILNSGDCDHLGREIVKKEQCYKERIEKKYFGFIGYYSAYYFSKFKYEFIPKYVNLAHSKISSLYEDFN